MTELPESPLVRLLDTRYGSLSVPAGKNDLITDFLEHYGEWASLEVEYLASLLPPKARVLDVGAYVGTFGLGIAQSADAAFVAMVEGNPAIAPHLLANASRNLSCTYEVLNALVVNSNAPPVGTGWADVDNAGSASFGEQASGTVPIPLPDTTISFRALVERFGPLDLIKLDVEGMEAQLLADHPFLLHDKSVLLWLECNEARSSLTLAQMLIDAGRPVTYFAWPSHNPDNHRGVQRKMFPFAYEAGLLLGAQATPLTPQQQRAGCLIRSIHTVEDLREALWLTPRWAPREWDVLDRNEIAAIATHLWLGKKRESFLAEAVPLNGGSPEEATARQVSATQDKNARLIAFRDARVAQLESKLAALVSQNLEMERAESSAVAAANTNELLARGMTEKLRAQHELHQEQVAALVAQLEESQVLHERHGTALAKQVAVLLEQNENLSNALYGIRSSLTWRIASRFSRLAGHIPLLKRVAKGLLRRKLAGAES
ncbi:FkbM family methyltransferase [Variovorax sp. CCNWLW225]|jgi:FkbM family methyltransferase|uniref:FkbM family methyltransferase n=1 Tax=Variovorax sp. CCNWLW225 TaxID=3127462 RepID=UPI0030771068